MPWQHAVPDVAYNHVLNVVYSAEKVVLLTCRWGVGAGKGSGKVYASLFAMSFVIPCSTMANWAIGRKTYYTGSFTISLRLQPWRSDLTPSEPNLRTLGRCLCRILGVRSPLPAA
jgi:hypothetical protein